MAGRVLTRETGSSCRSICSRALGGHNSLRSYADYRFHDRNMVLVNAEARVAMMTHVDAAVFVDAGNVAPRFGDLNLDKRSYGAGLRLHYAARRRLRRIDVARGERRLAIPLPAHRSAESREAGAPDGRRCRSSRRRQEQ